MILFDGGFESSPIQMREHGAKVLTYALYTQYVLSRDIL